MTPSEVLRKAADHIEVVGLHKGGFYAQTPGVPIGERPCCAMGAISYVDGFYGDDMGDYAGPIARGLDNEEVSRLTNLDLAATAAANLTLGATQHGRALAGWNDQESTTQADVVDLLRRAAIEHEAVPA